MCSVEQEITSATIPSCTSDMSVSSSAAFTQVPLSQMVLFGSAILFQCVAAPMLNVTRLIWYVDGDSSEAVGCHGYDIAWCWCHVHSLSAHYAD